MRTQLSNLRVLMLLVGVTVLAEAAPGRDVINDDHHPQHNDDELRVDKIIDGKDANYHRYPYMVFIGRLKHVTKEKKRAYGSCGGTLIDRYWVLTAAHCVSDEPSENAVLVLAYRMTHSLEYEKIKVARVIRHKQYNSATVDNDIALLKLKKPASPALRTARLEDNSWAQIDGWKYRRCVVAGWGRTTPGLARPSPSPQQNVLKEAHMAIFHGSEQCDKYWGNKGKSNICAAPRYNDLKNEASGCPHTGDSGGPLMCYDRKTKDYLQVGIIVHGKPFCRANEPALFTKVALHKGWIISMTGEDHMFKENP